MKKSVKLFLHLATIEFKSALQWKYGLFLAALSQILGSLSLILSIYFMMQRFHTIAGFHYDQVLFIFAIVMFCFSVSQCFFRSFDTFPHLIRSGELDRMLLRPKCIIFQVMGYKMDYTRLSKLIVSIVVISFIWPRVNIYWNFYKIFVFASMLIFGSLLFSLLFILFAGFSFFTIQGLEIFNILTDGAAEFGKYPVSIYGHSVLKITTFLIPYALFQYYPFLYLIDRTSNVFYSITPFLILIFMIPVLFIWKLGLKKYASTGS